MTCTSVSPQPTSLTKWFGWVGESLLWPDDKGGKRPNIVTIGSVQYVDASQKWIATSLLPHPGVTFKGGSKDKKPSSEFPVVPLNGERTSPRWHYIETHGGGRWLGWLVWSYEGERLEDYHGGKSSKKTTNNFVTPLMYVSLVSSTGGIYIPSL